MGEPRIRQKRYFTSASLVCNGFTYVPVGENNKVKRRYKKKFFFFYLLLYIIQCTSAVTSAQRLNRTKKYPYFKIYIRIFNFLNITPSIANSQKNRNLLSFLNPFYTAQRLKDLNGLILCNSNINWFSLSVARRSRPDHKEVKKRE